MHWTVVAAVAMVATVGCTPRDGDAIRALEASGFDVIELTGYEPFVCLGDELSTGFEATNARGQRVSGVVCCGIVRACTVRF